MRRPFLLNLCNWRFSNPNSCRHASTLIVKSDFTSFFFHNEQWTIAPSRKTIFLDVPSFRRNTCAVPIENLKSTARSLDRYQETEVLTPRRLLRLYAQLSKSRLTALIVLTAMSGFALSPLPATVPILLSTAVGTALCSASANTFNQLQEVPYDAQMTRTSMRPLVRRAVSPMHAAVFGAVTGVAGPVILWTIVNHTTAVLGAANIALYAGLYTWLKRKHVVNTWVGAVVGGLPPLMGWTACGGQLFSSSGQPFFLPQFLSPVPTIPFDLSLIDNTLAPLALFMLSFSWQFPHFNSLSHLVRGSYAQAGYQMLSVLSPSHNSLVALRHAILLVPICSILIPLSGLTTWTFALTSLVPNVICTRAAWRFWRGGGEKEAKIMFQHSLWYLPVVMALMMVHKQGMDWAKWIGLKSEDEAGDS
jgi:protoheme IX farnesyltransferase